MSKITQLISPRARVLTWDEPAVLAKIEGMKFGGWEAEEAFRGARDGGRPGAVALCGPVVGRSENEGLKESGTLYKELGPGDRALVAVPSSRGVSEETGNASHLSNS